MTDTSKLRETPESDALHKQWYGDQPQVADHCESLDIPSVWGLARTLERQRDELAEALRECEKAVARYQWLKQEDRKSSARVNSMATISWRNLGGNLCQLSDSDNLDALIDAQIEGERK